MIERTFVEQGIRNIELDKYLKSELGRAGFTKSEIVKTPLVTRIVVNVTSPGLAIGKGGQTIRQLTEEIKIRFKIDNPQLEIREIPTPNLDAQVVVDQMASMISRGFSWRSVVYRSLRNIMMAGAQGAEIIIKGVIAGKGQRKRKQRLAQGYMKKVGDQINLVGFGKASARTKIGNIGLKVRIVRPEIQFPDKIDVREYLATKKEVEEKTKKEPKEKKEKIKESEKKEEKPTEKKKEVKKAEKKEEEKKTEKKSEKKPAIKKEIK
ncbi:30S ribosomal protein S3 [Candidatus Micrarchaeota archaeon]|nr:30S ribosomal protein S3 [Candidatus Micrarchaeota archaeon]MBU1930735.1 30S ribosomal protein S3 [Candidatus Micrarchaeota archaeon]